ncbi:MAG: HEPN domain-containing protein [Bacteroidetes bacterium]|nr:HEPN domain-containing protein [Bacteroidota bacterium]
MNKEEIISHWITSSREDWKTARELYESKRYLHALFFVHLSIEKVCKALWIEKRGEAVAPFTHNLLRLLNEAGIELEEKNSQFLADLNKFQIEGRYPDYVSNIYKVTNRKLASNYLEQAKALRKWLIKKLPSNL